MRKVYCDYCGRETEYVDSKVIYGKSYGKIYLCRNCMAYVGVHKGTDKPLPMRNCGTGKRLHTPYLTLCGSTAAFAATATRLMRGWLRRWACPWRRPTSVCSMSDSAARLSRSLRKRRKETVMEDTKKTPAELVADLMLDPGFVLVPQDRYEELVRAETERDVLEATIKGENSYNVDRVLAAIQRARKAAWLKVSAAALNAEGAPEAGNDAE